jgi:starch phosphorylase
LTWTGPEFRQLFDANVPGWRLNPMLLTKFDAPYPEIEKAHRSQKELLIDYAHEKTGIKLNPDGITLRFSRRFTDYKRPDLLLSDKQTLEKASRGELLQVIYAGKAHPADQRGQELIHFINQTASELLPSNIRIVFIPDYNMHNAALLVQGVDLGLSNPQKTQEASATSLFKEAHNGTPHLGIQDGAFIEMLERASKFPVGWPIGVENGDDPRRRNPVEDAEDAEALYTRLGEIIRGGISPEYRRGAIVHTASHFNSVRMVKEYAKRAWGLSVTDPQSLEKLVG